MPKKSTEIKKKEESCDSPRTEAPRRLPLLLCELGNETATFALIPPHPVTDAPSADVFSSCLARLLRAMPATRIPHAVLLLLRSRIPRAYENIHSTSSQKKWEGIG